MGSETGSGERLNPNGELSAQRMYGSDSGKVSYTLNDSNGMIENGLRRNVGEVGLQSWKHRVLVWRVQWLDRMSGLRFVAAASLDEASTCCGQ